MKCESKLCSKVLVGRQRKFCSRKCQNIVNSRSHVNTRSATITGNTCKWCMDSEEGFCCDKHKGLYENFRKAVDSELARVKPKPTEEQMKGYKKIEWALINSRL